MGQIVAWISQRYGAEAFNLVTLKAQIYRSCVNVAFAQKYNTPKILSYDKQTRTYSYVAAPDARPQLILEGDEEESLESEATEQNLEEEDQTDLLVGVEAQLRDYLAKNLHKVETGLSFWLDNPPSVEFAIEGRRIDILAKDKEGLAVVIELKKHKAYDRVVGQGLLYQALVSARFKQPKVRVILVANEISRELRLACSRQQDFNLFEYELTMQLNPVDASSTEEEA